MLRRTRRRTLATLRRCRILASRLSNKEFECWVDRELNGYSNKEELPDYRSTTAHAHGTFIGPMFHSIPDAPIPPGALKVEHHHWAETVELREPIGAYLDMLQDRTQTGWNIEWPAKLIVIYARRFYEGRYALHQAWQHVSRNQVVAVADTVGNRVLMFALDLAKALPELAHNDELKPLQPATQDRVTQIFQNHFHATVGNVVSGSSGFSQHSAINVVGGDLQSLRKALAQNRVDQVDIDSLEHAMAEDQNNEPRYGPKTVQWLSDMMKKAADGAGQIALSTATTVLPKLLSKYFWLPD
jgi:AbiTii